MLDYTNTLDLQKRLLRKSSRSLAEPSADPESCVRPCDFSKEGGVVCRMAPCLFECREFVPGTSETKRLLNFALAIQSQLLQDTKC